MTQFSSRAPFPDTLDQRRTESWYGTAPVTLTRGDLQIDGHRQGRFGGVTVYRPDGDIDFGPERTHRVWSGGRFAELPDSEWERMGWTITVRQANPTNRVLARLRETNAEAGGLIRAGGITALDIQMDDATPDECKHALKVILRLTRVHALVSA